ncbi:MAG TPA: hypothetical protein VFL91_24015 [Thermomicrobiales bacterium]|nr:hypothetical protein [Thermomicrobiales bacterium]
MKQRIDLGQWRDLAPGARRRWADWCLERDYEPPAVAHGRHWEDSRLWHAPTVGQLIEFLAERERLDHDRWGLVVLPCEHGRLADLCDALWAAATALLEG